MSIPAFDPEAIRALAVILTETGLTEIEISDKDSRVRIARAAPAASLHVPHSQTSQASSVAAQPASVPADAPTSRDHTHPDADHPGAVLSPMVGVAYLSPEPGAPPFITEGQQVTAGQTLLLIEAMKTFNQIKAPRNGVVERVLIASGTPVEYGEVLMLLAA
jgi:acetyl-CoA carboxylase biotin carboxyl carrier protein